MDPFLTARWLNLAIITYDVDPSRLTDCIPPSCTLDVIDGRAFVSLVAFDFLDTRVLDVAWPGFVQLPRNQPSLLRARPCRSSGCFVHSRVGAPAVRREMARSIYNEPYFAVPMTSSIARARDRITTTHIARVAGRDQKIRVSGSTDTITPAATTREHFFKEHACGFGRSRGGRLITYEVSHAIWCVYRDPRIEQLDWDFAAIYGAEWGFLQTAAPYSLLFAVGSEVAVFPKGAVEKTRLLAHVHIRS